MKTPKATVQQRVEELLQIKLDGVNFIHDPFLQPCVFQHLAIEHALFLVTDAFERCCRNEWGFDWFSGLRHQTTFLAGCFRSRGTPPPATSATPTATRAGLFKFFVGRRFSILRSFSSRLQQRLDAFMCRLD